MKPRYWTYRRRMRRTIRVVPSSRPARRNAARTDSGRYRTGWFLTATTKFGRRLFGTVRDGQVVLTPAGQMVWDVWASIPKHYAGTSLDAFVVMPNHIHGILWVYYDSPLSMNDLVHRFKSFTTSRYRHGVAQLGWQPVPGGLWRRSAHDWRIRSTQSLQRIRRYIARNPAAWEVKYPNP